MGREEFGLGEPSPDIPPTDVLLLTFGRPLGTGGGVPLVKDSRLEAEVEAVRAGGVFPSYEELAVDEDLIVGIESFVSLVPPLLESVLLSVEFVRKEALDLLRRSLRNEGAIIHSPRGSSELAIK